MRITVTFDVEFFGEGHGEAGAVAWNPHVNIDCPACMQKAAHAAASAAIAEVVKANHKG